MKIQGIRKTGDQVNWEVSAINEASFGCPDGKITFTIPDGVRMIGPRNAPHVDIAPHVGAYDPVNTVWIIGDLPANSTISEIFQFEVTDISKATQGGFEIKAEVSSGCRDDVLSDNIAILSLSTIYPCIDASISIGKGFPMGIVIKSP